MIVMKMKKMHRIIYYLLAYSKPANIMWDRRVVRGNTYSSHVLTGANQEEAQRLLELQQREFERKHGSHMFHASYYKKPQPPPEPEPEEPMEPIYDIPRELDIYEQNDEFLDRPPTPIFVPAKILVESAAQVTEDELFNFDYEVKPILEVLTGKTCEQALMEVLEEEEERNIQKHKYEFEYRRNIELLEVQRMEAADKRLIAEREKRRIQEAERKKKQKIEQLKIDSRLIAKQIVDELQNNVMKELFDNDYFGDTSAKDIEKDFIPWLFDQAQYVLNGMTLSERLIDKIIRAAIQKERSIHSEKIRQLEEERQRREEEKKKMENEQMLMTKEEAEQKAYLAEMKRIADEEARKAAEERDGEEEEEEDESDEDD